MQLQQQFLKAIARMDIKVSELEERLTQLEQELHHDRVVIVQTLARVQQQVDELVSALLLQNKEEEENNEEQE